MNTKPKSGSEKLHKFLCNKPLGFRFTCAELEALTKHYDFGEGVVTGFIARAKRKGMIAAVASQRGKGNRRAVIYEVINHDGWKFHGPGIGSRAGREITPRKHDPIPPLVDLMMNNPAEEIIPEPKEEEFEIERVLMECEDGSLADRLMDLAIQVNALENKKPSLSEFTTDELLEELRSRVK